MPIRFKCAGCGQTMQVADTAAGKRVKCRTCQQVTRVPDAGHAAPTSAASGKRRRSRADSDEFADDVRMGEDTADNSRQPLLKCRYGALPKLMLFGAAPFLGILAVVMFVAATFSGFALKIRGVAIPSWAVAYLVSPVLLVMAVLTYVAEFYQRKYPRHIVATTKGLTAPSSPFSRKKLQINWHGMKYNVQEIVGIRQVTMKNTKQKVTVRLASGMFATEADFERFLEIVDERAEAE